MFALYEDANLPVIPIALDTGRYLPHGKLLIKPGQVQVSFLSPIAPGLERKIFMARLETAIESEIEQFQRRYRNMDGENFSDGRQRNVLAAGSSHVLQAR